MLWNLLLVDPDNVPGGIGNSDTNSLLIILITAIAIIITICAGYIINKQHKQITKLENRNGKAGSIGIWIITILICVLFITLCIIFYKNIQP